MADEADAIVFSVYARSNAALLGVCLTIEQ